MTAAKTLLIASQKGGAGKTTLCGLLSVEAAGRGARVLMLDLDPQQSLRGWWGRREADAPEMLPEDPAPSQVPKVLDRARGMFDLVVIDTPPAAHGWIGRLALAADLTLVPVQPSPHDIGAVGATVSDLGRAKWAFVISRSQARTTIAAEARVILAQHGRVAPVDVRQRVSHAESAGRGMTGAEWGDGSAAYEAGQLAEWCWRDVDAHWRHDVRSKRGTAL